MDKLISLEQMRLPWALYVSSPIYIMYENWIKSSNPIRRHGAVYARARAVVLFDRTLNDEQRAIK